MSHVIEVYGGGFLLQELDASDPNLGKLSRFNCLKRCILLIICLYLQSSIIQDTLNPLALIDSIDAAFLVRFVGLYHNDLVKAGTKGNIGRVFITFAPLLKSVFSSFHLLLLSR